MTETVTLSLVHAKEMGFCEEFMAQPMDQMHSCQIRKSLNVDPLLRQKEIPVMIVLSHG